MQMIKSEKGVTLVVLVITIIVLIIIVGVSIDLGVDSVESTTDRKLQSELQMIEQATAIEYAKAIQLAKIEEGIVPSNFIGEPIVGMPSIILSDGNAWYFAEHTSESPTGYKSYFRLTPEHLEQWGIENAEDTYIVNYYTGEVYNETEKVTSTGEDLYIRVNKATDTTQENNAPSFIN